MIEQGVLGRKENRMWRIDAVLIAYIFAARMIITASDKWNGVFHIVFCVCIVAEFLFIFSRIFSAKCSNTAGKILQVYLVWLVVSRAICGDTSFSASSIYIMLVALCVCLFGYGAMLDTEQRQCVLTVVFIGVCAFYFVVGIAGIYAALTRSVVGLPLDITVGIKAEGDLRYLTAFGRHRNITAQWNCLCVCLAAYLFSMYKNRIFRIVLMLVAAVCYVMVALSLSRTTMISLSVALAMIAMLYINRKLFRKSVRTRAFAMTLAAVLIVLLSYKGFSVVGSAMESLSYKIISAEDCVEEHSSAGAAMDLSGENTVELKADDVLFTETRDSANVKELGGRMPIWRSELFLLRMEPGRLLHGSLDNEYMTMINIFNHWNAKDTHNYLLETLLLTGLPGLLLVLAFTLILVLRMVRVFFAPGAELSAKLLTLPFATILLKNMGEAILLRYDDITNYVFFLAAGAFLAYSYELFPEKSLKK